MTCTDFKSQYFSICEHDAFTKNASTMLNSIVISSDDKLTTIICQTDFDRINTTVSVTKHCVTFHLDNLSDTHDDLVNIFVDGLTTCLFRNSCNNC